MPLGVGGGKSIGTVGCVLRPPTQPVEQTLSVCVPPFPRLPWLWVCLCSQQQSKEKTMDPSMNNTLALVLSRHRLGWGRDCQRAAP